MFQLKFNDDACGVIATKSEDAVAILIYHYLDPEAGKNYLNFYLGDLNNNERFFLLNLIRLGELEKIFSGKKPVNSLRTSQRLKNILLKASQLAQKAQRPEEIKRILKIQLKNINGNFLYQRFAVDSSCGLNCEIKPIETKELTLDGIYEEELVLSAHSVNFLLFEKKPEVDLEKAKEEPTKEEKSP